MNIAQMIPALALLAASSAVQADTLTDDIVSKLASDGFEYIEIRTRRSKIKIEALRGTEKLERLYDAETGELLEEETETASEDDIASADRAIKAHRKSRKGDVDEVDDSFEDAEAEDEAEEVEEEVGERVHRGGAHHGAHHDSLDRGHRERHDKDDDDDDDDSDDGADDDASDDTSDDTADDDSDDTDDSDDDSSDDDADDDDTDSDDS